MNIRKVSPRFFVSEQISALDVGAVAAQGIKTIMCNRPDNEKQGQPAASEIAAAAEALDISFVNLPVMSGAISDENVEDFARSYIEAPGPILAYCRSGMRSTMLWALTEASTMEVDAILVAAKGAGYDLVAIHARLVGRSSLENN